MAQTIDSGAMWREYVARLRFDVLMSDKSNAALSRVLKAKVEIVRLDQANPKVAELAAVLAPVPPGLDCECCGFRGLVNVCRVGGRVVGPECAGHPFGSCKHR